METRPVDGLMLYFDPSECETADLLADACRETLRILRDRWKLPAPVDCRVYVMTSWLTFMFQGAPWPWRLAMALTLPFWSRRARQMWPLAGGFHQAYGRRRVIGVKPARLIQAADRSVGERIFVPAENEDLDRKVQHVACHELTHACAAHLNPPMWLNEGLAMLTVDLYAGRQTVRPDTLALLTDSGSSGDPAGYRDIRADDPDGLLYHAVRGYWLLRYLHDRHPNLLALLLKSPHDQETTTRLLADAEGVDESRLWGAIDGIVADHFEP
jgi:hypothetical protein